VTPERVLQHPPLVLDQRTRERSFEDGFLTVPGYVDAAWFHRLRAVVAAKIEESLALTALPGTHRGPLFEQFDDEGRWTAPSPPATSPPCPPTKPPSSAGRQEPSS
jgi:hypothetical protein